MEAIGTLYLRGKKWRWKVKVPADLTHLHKYLNDEGKPKQNAADVNLKTEDKKEAQAKATIQAAQWAAVFDADRKGLAVALQPPTPITPELGEAIAQSVYRMGLEQDDALRETTEGMAALDAVHAAGAARSLVRLGIPGRPLPVVETSAIDAGLTDGAAAALSSLTTRADEVAAAALSKKRLATVKPLAEEAVKRLGLSVDWDAPEGLQTLRRCLEAHRKAWQDRSRRDAGEVVSTPEPVSIPAKAESAKAHRLSQVFEKWKSSGDNPGDGTIRKKAVSLRLYEEFTKDAAIEFLTPEQGTEFSGWLLQRCKAEKTAKDHLDGVKSLLNKATRSGGLGWLKENPWEGVRVKVKKKVSRKPWASDALVKLFASPLFNAYELPGDWRAGGAAAYWVPLLALYSGARQSELCQLRVNDVVKTSEGLVVHITSEAADEDEGAEETGTKSESSERRLPVHPALLALGFEEYWNETKQAGHAALFPDVRRQEGRPAGEDFGRWFSLYRGQQGVKKRWQDFHAFRHTVSTKLTDAGVSDSVANYITGHTGGGRGAAGTYKHFQDTLSSLEKLQYPELDLKRIYWPQN